MPAASRMKRHSAPTPESSSTAASPPPPPSPPPRLPSPPPIHPSRPPRDDESDATSLTSVSSDGAGGDKKVKAAQSFEALFNNESLSDFLLDVNQGHYVFHAHKMIVGLKSERLAALITTSASSGTVSASSTSGNLSTSGNNNNNSNMTMSNTSTFTAGNTIGDKGKKYQAESPGSGCVKPTLYLHESPECGAVFGRFLYFIYSGAVWLHRDYVLPLHALSVKYGVAALASHCENYIQQLLQKCMQAAADAAAAAANHSTTTTNKPGQQQHKEQQQQQPAATSLLPASAVCDVYEAGWDMFGEETRREAFAVLTRRFPELCRSERWADCAWATVRELLRSDACACDENVMLVAATDWMKRTRLQDKARIQELLSSIRYPRLPRRVLYHLHTTASFRNFPPVQALIEAAIRYHCFRDVPEARDEFTGRQYRSRGGRPASRHTVCGGEHACCKSQGGSSSSGGGGGEHTPSGESSEMSNSNSNSNSSSGGGGLNPHDIAQPNEWGGYGDPADFLRRPDDRGGGADGHNNNNNTNNNNNMDNPQQRPGEQHLTPNNNSPDLVSDSRVVVPGAGSHNAHASNTQRHNSHQQNNSNNHRRAHHHHNHQHQQHQHQHHGCRNQHAARANRHHTQQQHHQQHHQHQHAPQCRSCYDGHQRHQGSPVAAVQPRVHTPPEGDRLDHVPRQAVAPHHSMTSSRHAAEGSMHAEVLRHVDAINSTSDRPDLPTHPPPFTRV